MAAVRAAGVTKRSVVTAMAGGHKQQSTKGCKRQQKKWRGRWQR